MTNTRGIHSTPHQNDTSLIYGTSYGSTFSDLSLNSRDVIMADQWIILGKIGEGSFGEVFEVRDINTHQHYAVKRETMRIKHPQLQYENVMYNVLSGGVGIPQCHWYGQFDGFDCLVMDLLGPNLGQVRQNVSCMELDIAVDLLSQMVSIVEHIHNRGVIVRDIKPDNFLFPSKCQLPEAEMIESVDEFGMPTTTYKKSTCRQIFTEQWGIDKPRIYAVDFGLACYWRDPETGKTHPDTKKHIRSKTGTARYASINVHKGRSHSRRDDVESLGYILLDLLLGTLPWTGIHAKNSKAGWDRMRQLKIDTFMSDLCAGLPRGVLEFVEYPRTLQFGDQPDYEKMRRFLQGCLPGGAYSDIVKSPFGGEAKPTDNYDIIQLELKQMQQKIQEERRQFQLINGPDHDNGLFAMDDMAHHLPTATVPESNLPPPPENQQRKDSTASQSSLKKLLKQNRAKKVGWNTWKHDHAPWNPKTDWTIDEDLGANMARSWGDDQQGLGTWGVTSDVQQDKPDSWNENADDVEIKWDQKPSWDATPTTQSTLNEPWKKADNLEIQWDQKPSWDATPTTQPILNEPWKKTGGDMESNWRNPPQQVHTESWRKPRDETTGTPDRNGRRGRFKSESNNSGQQQPARRRHVSQPHQNHLANTKPRYRTPQQQRQQQPLDQPDSHLRTPEDTQVDGWQRKPGSNSWQQKG